MSKYIVMTNGRSSVDYPEMHPNDDASLTMDVRSIHGRIPITLIQAKQRAAHIVQTEKGVKVYICKVEFVAEEKPSPVIIRKFDE